MFQGVKHNKTNNWDEDWSFKYQMLSNIQISTSTWGLTNFLRTIILIHTSRSLSYARPTASSTRHLHRERSTASYFSLYYPILSLRSYSSRLRLLPRPSVTSIITSLVPSITCFRRQSESKMWTILLAFLRFIVCRIFLSSRISVTFISHTIGQNDLLHPSPAPHLGTIQVFVIYFPKCPSFRTT